ncbi:MAG: hypothetical protein HY026_04720 [Deltaproteobacteria bacterium]|nr:hypothetical protein [Deltaproteobacteria bacterium]
MTKIETEKALNQLVEKGLGSYLDALIAVREFQSEIIKRSRRALKGKLDNLLEAMGISVDRTEIEIKDYLSEELDDWGWVGITFKKEPMECYFGLYFKRQDSKCVAKVTASMWAGKASQRNFLLKHCNNVPLDSDHDGNEIGLSDSISKEEINNFEAKLQELIDKWIEVWESIGGIKKLLK